MIRILNFLKKKRFITKEAANAEIDRLTESLVVEAQEKNYLAEEILEFDKCSKKIENISEEFHMLKDQNGSLQVDLPRYEDKAALLREKLFMVVKKGKGLVQERDSLKQQMAEKNAQIEELKTDLIHQEERTNYRVIEATNEIAIPIDVTYPVEKAKWCDTYLNECQLEKVKVEHEGEGCAGDVKDEAGKLASQLQRMIAATDEVAIPTDVTEPIEKVKRAIKSLEDALSVSEQCVTQLIEEKRKVIKTNTEEELRKAIDDVYTHAINLKKAYKTIKSLEDTMSQLQTHVSQFSN
ncbi:hypothetical protein Tco_1296209, partial [Tanacetum coccineum]